MAIKVPFITLDVFTSQDFLGNPLAIVQLPSDVTLSQEQKQLIAREFNLSETVFLHETESNNLHTMDIFTTKAELPFAGHPTIGTGWHLLSRKSNQETITLRTKAGDIPVSRLAGERVQLKVPTNFKNHAPISLPGIKAFQPKLQDADYANGLEGAEAVASIVKGMTFVLLQVSSEGALAKLQTLPEILTLPELGDWASFVGLYAFVVREDGVIRTRMFDGAVEDPATGSAASTLAGWLAQRKGPGAYKFQIIQGVEMGRTSHIALEVKVGKDNVVEEIFLSGEAVEVIEGTIRVPEQTK
ncbi:hypothetical protein CPB83DRAFT_856657 [Crepidotus variabilis]|uniref:Phenazine biosynthesis-like protein n=1 Tax=Crepidotus variabilis TaxID=179855 RepID=A0A9P6JND3_9AGAR|nr:hypothetical protein CPB83DRAFT_856657 [Crepidotus variabilis]